MTWKKPLLYNGYFMKKSLFLLLLSWWLLGAVNFTLENYSLFYNFEYKSNPYYDGRTFFGDWLQGFFSFRINPKVKVEAGALLWRFYGGNRQVLPYLAAVFSPSQKLSFRFGNLRKFHGLHRALYFDTLHYERPAERGFQIIYDGRHIKGEAWINWQREMRKLVQEKFDVGAKLHAEGGWLFADLHYHYVHFGGEYLEHHVGPQDDMAFMGRGGLKFSTPLGTGKISAAYFRSYFIPDRWEPLRLNGRGTEAAFSLSGRYGEFFVSRWWGKDFYHQDGDPLYQGQALTWLGYRKEVILNGFHFALALTSGWVNRTWVPYQKIEIIWKKTF